MFGTIIGIAGGLVVVSLLGFVYVLGVNDNFARKVGDWWRRKTRWEQIDKEQYDRLVRLLVEHAVSRERESRGKSVVDTEVVESDWDSAIPILEIFAASTGDTYHYYQTPDPSTARYFYRKRRSRNNMYTVHLFKDGWCMPDENVWYGGPPKRVKFWHDGIVSRGVIENG